MKVRIFLTVFVLLLFVGCSSDNSSNNNPLTENDVLETQGSAEINTDDYDVVVMDDDGWYINLNVVHITYCYIKYKGYLQYSYGSRQFSGEAWAYYDRINDILSISAIDNGWSASYVLNYSFIFTDSGLNGFYFYNKSGSNGYMITATIESGNIGDHVSSKSVSGTILIETAREKNVQE